MDKYLQLLIVLCISITVVELDAYSKVVSQYGKGNVLSERWATGQGFFEDRQKWLAGDFNGDGKDDLAKVYIEKGKASIDVHLSGSGAFKPQRWAMQQGSFWDEQKWLAGDFNGDGKDDLAKVYIEKGKASIDVHLSGGGAVKPQRWATQQGSFWDEQKWLAGDFNGNGKNDLAKIFLERNRASIDVHLSQN